MELECLNMAGMSLQILHGMWQELLFCHLDG